MTWRLDLARRAIRTAARNLDAGKRDRADESLAFARKMLADEDVLDYEEAKRDGRVSETSPAELDREDYLRAYPSRRTVYDRLPS